MNALLLYPRVPVTYRGFQYTLRLIGKRFSLPPPGLITVAALLPEHWRPRLKDLHPEDPDPEDPGPEDLNPEDLGDEDVQWADLVLTGGQFMQVASTQEAVARALEVPVTVGGLAPATSPEPFRDAAAVFCDKADGRIDELVHALTQHSERHCVIETSPDLPHMTTDPVSRFDLLDFSEYASLRVPYRSRPRTSHAHLNLTRGSN